MSAAKKTNSVPIVPPWLRQTVALLFGPGRTCTLAVLVVAAFSGGAWAVWRHVEKHVEGSRDYLVSVEQIAITPQPEWVRSDVRAEAFRTASSPDRPLSSLDDGLAERIFMAFKVHPWVAKAAVTKRAGARVNVDIVYRRPGLHGGGCQRGTAQGRRSICCPSTAKAFGFPARTSRRSRRRRTPVWQASITGQFSPWDILGAMPALLTVPRLQRRSCPFGNNSSCIAFRRRPGLRRRTIEGRRMNFTRARDADRLGAGHREALPRASPPRQTRLPVSYSMRRFTEVSTPDHRWMSAGFRRWEPRSNRP